MTASNIHEVEKRLNNALNDMSPELSEIIRDALGPRPQPKLEIQDSLNVSNMGKGKYNHSIISLFMFLKVCISCQAK